MRSLHKGVQLVLIERGGTAFWRWLAAVDRKYVTQAEKSCQLAPTFDHDFGTGERVRIWDVVRCGADTRGGIGQNAPR
jgi:hypothetical protein